MCDYSLYEFPNRLAQEREELVVYRFPSGAIGLASADDVRNAKPESRDSKTGIWAGLKQFLLSHRHTSAVCAVCVPPGARLLLKDIPAGLRRTMGLAAEENAVFVELSANAHTYRDAVRFGNGAQVRLQDLSEGQGVRILSLGVESLDAEPLSAFQNSGEQRRASEVEEARLIRS